MRIPGASGSRGPRSLDERRDHPADQDAGENEETDREEERDPDGHAGEGGHGALTVNRKPEGRRPREMRDQERSRFSSSKAVVATFLFFGLILTAGLIFVVVVIQRAC